MNQANIKNLIKKCGKVGGSLLAFMTVESYGRGLIKDIKVDEAVNELISNNKRLTDLTAELRDDLIFEMVKRNKVQELLNSGVMPKLENTSTNINEMKTKLANLIGDETELKNTVIDALKELEASTDESKEFVKRVLEIVDNGGSNSSNQFIPWDTITHLFSRLSQGIDSLSQTQK